METKISIIQFLFTYEWKVLTDSLGANPSLNYHRFSTSSELLQFCSGEQNCLIIANVSSKKDLIQLATFVKVGRNSLKDTVLKIVVVNKTENKQIERALQKIGSIEILEPSVNVKALRFKMDFWMKAMRGQAKKNGTMTQKTLEQTKTVESVGDGKAINMLPPLECESDIWILSRESDCKKIISRWMVKMMGPSPYVASWNDVPGKQNVWSFEIKKSFVDIFLSGQGTWFFTGDQKPEFNWKENRWMFTGENLELFFFFETKPLSRLKIDNRVLTLAGNSVFAKTKEDLIVDSFNRDLVFKNDAEMLEGNSVELEKEGDLGGNLQGKTKDNSEYGKGNLRGRIKDQDKGTDGKLEGKIQDSEEAQSGNLYGKNKKQESPDSEDKKHTQSQEKIGSHWDGKLSKEELAAKEEKEHKQQNDKLDSHWGGKLSREEIAAKEEKEHKQQNDKLRSNWSGKNSSDSIDTNGISGPATGIKEGSSLDQKNTNTEHQTHYKNHNEATKYDAQETQKNQYRDAEESDLGGKSSTDNISAHYANGAKPDAKTGDVKEKKSPFADLPKGKVEKISSHMASKKRPATNNSGIDLELDSGSDKTSAGAAPEDLQFDNFELNGAAKVLPFADKAKGPENLDRITENSKITAFISQNGNNYECALEDYFDNNVIFLCQGEGLKNSEKAKLDITLDYQAKKTQIKCDGVVMSIDQDAESGFFVTIEISPSDAKKFDQFMGLLKSRQENIDTFLQKVKGY